MGKTNTLSRSDSGDVTQLLKAIESGDPWAAEELLPLVYEELRRLAARKMAQEAAGHTLHPTDLVHEAYLRLVRGGDAGGWENRGHFYAAAAEAMRRILIEAARRKASRKRGGGRKRVELPRELADRPSLALDELLALDEALERLESEDPQSFRLVMLRYFGGLTVAQTASALGLSSRTVKRHWAFARAWLQREMERP